MLGEIRARFPRRNARVRRVTRRREGRGRRPPRRPACAKRRSSAGRGRAAPRRDRGRAPTPRLRQLRQPFGIARSRRCLRLRRQFPRRRRRNRVIRREECLSRRRGSLSRRRRTRASRRICGTLGENPRADDIVDGELKRAGRVKRRHRRVAHARAEGLAPGAVQQSVRVVAVRAVMGGVRRSSPRGSDTTSRRRSEIRRRPRPLGRTTVPEIARGDVLRPTTRRVPIRRRPRVERGDSARTIARPLCVPTGLRTFS